VVEKAAHFMSKKPEKKRKAPRSTVPLEGTPAIV
jgi:hypothetical protein